METRERSGMIWFQFYNNAGCVTKFFISYEKGKKGVIKL